MIMNWWLVLGLICVSLICCLYLSETCEYELFNLTFKCVLSSSLDSLTLFFNFTSRIYETRPTTSFHTSFSSSNLLENMFSSQTQPNEILCIFSSKFALSVCCGVTLHWRKLVSLCQQLSVANSFWVQLPLFPLLFLIHPWALRDGLNESILVRATCSKISQSSAHFAVVGLCVNSCRLQEASLMRAEGDTDLWVR